NGRNALSLASLSPNVSFGFPAAGQAGSRQGGIRTDRSISIAGQRSQFNHFTLDGIENTDPNLNSHIVEPSVDALQEFKVKTGIYPAEFGRGTSQINMSTKSGSNQFHGTAYEFLRNEKLDARNYAFTSARPPKDPFKWNQFGFTLGGPVWIPQVFNGKNRLFFMTNYEWFRQRRTVQGLFTVPAAAAREGDYSALPFGTTGIWDPATRANPGASGGTQFAGNRIPATASIRLRRSSWISIVRRTCRVIATTTSPARDVPSTGISLQAASTLWNRPTRNGLGATAWATTTSSTKRFARTAAGS
ncbi:MAG: hypothetical protein SGI92_11785, partial [Bryobacteraceae bacterium]|nr:hypothetical protein [Bryobacteraceae bacterium]